jgi:hypothetical protein
MPDVTLEQAIREAYASAPQGAVLLETLEWWHPTFAAPIRVVADHADHTLTLEASAPRNPSQAVLCTAFAFRLQRPEVNEQGHVEMLIEIDNVSREIEDAFAAAAVSTDKLEVIYRTYLSTDPSGPQNDPPLTFTARRAPADNFMLRVTAVYGDFVNRKFPGQKYTLARFPGLVR